jgi:hypothetical protein
MEIDEDSGEEVTGLVTVSKKMTDFNQQMLLEMAYGMESADVIRRRYGIEDDQWKLLIKNPYFRDALGKHVADLKRNGTTFKAKAQVLAEDVLPISHAMATDTRVPAAIRLDAVKWLAKVSGMDESDKKQNGTSGNNVQVNINLG